MMPPEKLANQPQVPVSLQQASVLGYPLAAVTMAQAVDWCLAHVALAAPSPALLVTLNPEIVVQAEQDSALAEALRQAQLTVADGVGVVWAARRAGLTIPGRVPGVELMQALLGRGGSRLRVYFLGAKPGVAARAAQVAQARYGTVIAGVQHGYFQRDTELPTICQAIAASRADVLFAGLGPGQEALLHSQRQALQVPLLMGVGGSLDVLAGEVQRTPVWTHRLGLEWAWRIGSDPKRWHRFPRLLRFVALVRRHRHE